MNQASNFLKSTFKISGNNNSEGSPSRGGGEKPAMLKQSSKLLLMNLKKDRVDLDYETEQLDITNILGCDLDDDSISVTDQEAIKEALVKGYDLRQYSVEVEDNLNQLFKSTINDYFQENGEFLYLYSQIQEVDGVLIDLEKILNDFYQELKSVGSEMSTLQERSMSMSHKLNNRKNVTEKLSKFIEEVNITNEFAGDLLKSEINEDYIKKLQKLDIKITIFDEYKTLAPTIISTNDKPLSKLTVDAIVKIQKFLDLKLNSSFKKLSEKRQKQAQLANMGYLFQFLFKYSSFTAGQVVSAFIENAEKYYTAYYKNYISALLKLQEDGPSKNDFIGIQTSKLKSLFNSNNTNSPTKTTNSAPKDTHTLSLLGNRTDILNQESMESPPIDVPITVSFLESGIVQLTNIATAQNAPQVKYPFEQVYRSILYFLMDVLSSETLFIRDFFLGGEDIPTTIFAKCMTLIVETTDSCLHSSYDLISISLIMALINRYKTIMFGRGITVLNATFDKILSLAMHRFLKILKTNTETIKTINIKDLKPITPTQPHLIIRKFTDLLVVLFNTLYYSQKNQSSSAITENIKISIHKVVSEISENTERFNKEIADPSDQLVFYINTYGTVLQTLQEYYNYIEPNSTSDKEPNTLSTKIILNYKNQFNKSLSKYIYKQLHQLKYLSQFINFVQEWGPLVESSVKIDPRDNPSFNQENVSKILESFNVNWQSAIAEIRDLSLKNFLQCEYASNRAYDILINEIYECYRYLLIIIDKSFESIKTSSSHYKGDEVIQKLQKMNPNLTIKQ